MADDDQRTSEAEGRFALNLREIRERAGLSQQAVAQSMRGMGHPHIRQQTVAKIEAGTRSVRLGEALAFAQILGVKVDDLVRPQRLATEAWTILEMARQCREARDSILADVRQLISTQIGLRDRVASAEAEGYARVLAGELYVGRQAADYGVFAVLRALVEERAAYARMPGNSMTQEERSDALKVAELLRELAEEGTPSAERSLTADQEERVQR